MTTVEPILDGEWVDELLLAGPDREICLRLGEPVDRATLRRWVALRQSQLAAHGLRAGGSVALRLPGSVAYIANLLAAWRIGAQVTLLDHRLTPHEVDRALERVAPQVVVAAKSSLGGALRGYHDVTETVSTYPGTPAETPHAVVQLSSGSTGPSKVIGRTAANLVAEVDRYTRIDGVPLSGERIVCLASPVHVLGLVGGLLYGLHAHATVVVPERLTVDGIARAVGERLEPATLLGVPFHLELLASVTDAPRLPQLKRMTTGGELVRADVARRFDDRYGVPLGNMYGMTEVGVIATDLFGRHRPAVLPAPGIAVRAEAGELLVGLPASPYLGLADPTRWTVDRAGQGWLHTRDAGTADLTSGLVTILGRLDSQVSVGGLKVDLSEVEQTLATLPGVGAAVVLFDDGIEAYAMCPDPADAAGLADALAARLAPYKRPRRLHLVDQLPRTATGKLVRDRAALRAAARHGPAP